MTETSTGGSNSMTFRDFEELCNRWTVQFEEDERVFQETVEKIKKWDRIMADNADKITELHQTIQKAKMLQEKVERDLDFIHSQRTELEEAASALEKEVKNLPPVEDVFVSADKERSKIFKMLAEVDEFIKSMNTQIDDMVGKVNAEEVLIDDGHELNCITEILNSHAASLQWIDEQVEEIKRVIGDSNKQQ